MGGVRKYIRNTQRDKSTDLEVSRLLRDLMKWGRDGEGVGMPVGNGDVSVGTVFYPVMMISG